MGRPRYSGPVSHPSKRPALPLRPDASDDIESGGDDDARDPVTSPGTLRGKHRRYLRGLGHHLDPVILVGKEGVSDGLVGATDAALGQHELIKVRLGESAGDRRELAEELAGRTGAELVQVLGRTVLLYRQHPEEPRITLPA